MTRKKRKETGPDRFFYEDRALKEGFNVIAGIDEAGRGPLAGPVVAAAVVVRNRVFTNRIDDSKKLTPLRREKAFLEIIDKCDTGIGSVAPRDIDRLNIYNATLLAMKRAVEELKFSPDYLLIDGHMNVDLPQRRLCIVKGESASLSIAAASIIAKVFRDRIMIEEDARYPCYGFKKHKGYGTKEHIENIRKHGLSHIHRKTFGPFGSRTAFSETRKKEENDYGV